MNTDKKVFITGAGAITATGTTLSDTWNALLEGRSGLAPIESFEISTWPNRLGGEIRVDKPASLLPDKKLMKAISRQDVFGINAAMQALEHSGLPAWRASLECTREFDDASGVYVGSPGNKYYQQYDFLPLIAKTEGNLHPFAEQLFEEVHPMWLLRILPNNVLAYTGIAYGLKGPNHNISNHATGGAQALIEAAHAIRAGQAERIVVVAYDVAIEPQALFYYERLGVLSATGVRPFDASHDGTVLAEGACAFVLESEESVRARDAACLGEVMGGFSATEAGGLFALQPDGESLTGLLENTLEGLGLTAADIGLVVAHGNGNPLSDDSEAAAVYNVLGDIPVTAFKWSMGHTVAASGLLDAVLAAEALNAGVIPGVAGFTQNSGAPINISAAERPLEGPRCALVINRGFGGMNVCTVLRACE
ncbi:3-oxoacyl-ACP synthase [Legionella geestiana]|uniref:beta-ketoacyl-[acyl-carrier-protein] synthase family protein n=1 Tax=Legionella geestiana TaxID=45065 RepID=UPI0010922B04|nr:beta-ketoacyl synthase N-terminal-like domain-containing protein [Legionella geestiana]QDQ39322.1 3-oxoacyl-ACP synthase [Legionella geestiana]